MLNVSCKSFLNFHQSETRIVHDGHVFCRIQTNRLISMVYYLYQLTHHWNLQFREKYFLKFQPIKTKKCRWRPCFLPDQNEIKKFCRRPRKHNFCKVLIDSVVLEEMTKMWSVNDDHDEQTCKVVAIAHMVLCVRWSIKKIV